MMIGKIFTIAERLRAEFRAETFNVTNTPPLGNPSSSFGNAAFGTITAALDPRVFEHVLKLQFLEVRSLTVAVPCLTATRQGL